MGHLADLEVALDHLKRTGLEAQMLVVLGDSIVCLVRDLVLTDRSIVRLYKAGKLDLEGLKSGRNSDKYNPTGLQIS
jgi:hypothetical protein